jgi:hypothetical protein
MNTNTAFTRFFALRWCRNHKSAHRDRTTGELDYTGLAEACAEAFEVNGVGGPLDDSDHWIWEVAVESE